MNKNLVSLFLIGFALYSPLAMACDDLLKNFKTDCEYQDRYVKVREIYRKHNLDVTDVARYKALRFIDSFTWEMNLLEDAKKAPLYIYEPAPATWFVWSEGLSQLFSGDSGKGLFANRLAEKKGFDKKTISHINKILLTNGKLSTKDPNTDRYKYPGEFRSWLDDKVGYCSPFEFTTNQKILSRSQESVRQYQLAWEKKAGISFVEAVSQAGGRYSKTANMIVPLKLTDTKCSDGRGNFVSFSSSMDVTEYINWLQAFIRYNFQRYAAGTPLISPIELSAVVQKWFVTIHPFADGNGRTSRVIQDMILQNFDLPFAPAGELQFDAQEPVDAYVDETYDSMGKMLTFLENCSKKIEQGVELDYECKSVTELNKQ
jgi:hypothetical protein